MSVPSDNTPFGHLVLTMTSVDYLVNMPDLFEPPRNFGNGTSIALGDTAPTIIQAHWAFQVDKKIHDVYHATDKALKFQLLATVEEVCYRDLHDDYVRYASVSTQLLLDHLWAVYGQIDNDQLAAKTVRMGATWSYPTPINNLFEHPSTTSSSSSSPA